MAPSFLGARCAAKNTLCPAIQPAGPKCGTRSAHPNVKCSNEEEKQKSSHFIVRRVTRPKRPGLNPGYAGAKPAEAG